jgi:CheY-like chemotaxis protein
MRRVLLVDHDPVTRTRVETYLRADGYDVVGACSRSEAVALAARMGPDLALVDTSASGSCAV